MFKNHRARRVTTYLLLAGAVTFASSAAGSAQAAYSKASTAKCGTVTLADNAWVGYEANLAVVSYVLKHNLGCKVVVKNISEEISWQGFASGQVDVILENWGHDDLAKKYIKTQKVAVDLGLTGNRGRYWLVCRPLDGQEISRYSQLQEFE